jgi:hypothetical protein
MNVADINAYTAQILALPALKPPLEEDCLSSRTSMKKAYQTGNLISVYTFLYNFNGIRG